jgi:LPS export ABC transporter protein LptC
MQTAHFLIYRLVRSLGISLSLVALCLMSGCNTQNQAVTKLAKDSKQLQDEFDNSLIFNAVTLEEFDAKGKLWWQVKAKQAKYSKDKKTAQVEQPIGQLFQDGKPILKVTAQKGEVEQDGKRIFLKGNVVAIDLRDNTTLKGSEMEWQLKNDLLIVRNKLNGIHKDAELVAKEGKYNTKLRQLDLTGQVVAITKEPKAQFRTEHAVFLTEKQTMTCDRPVQIDRYQNDVITDRAVANQATANFKEKTAKLTENAQVFFTEPAMQISSNSLLWNLNAQTVTSDQPLTVLNQQDQTTLTANQGSVDIKAQTANLKQNAQVVYSNPPIQVNSNSLVLNQTNQTVTSDQPVTVVNRQDQVTVTANQGVFDQKSNTVAMAGNVYGVSAPNNAQVNADRLNLNLTSQDFQADGNVVYQQASPALNLSGPSASGKFGGLEERSVVVSGGRVTTEFVP